MAIHLHLHTLKWNIITILNYLFTYLLSYLITYLKLRFVSESLNLNEVNLSLFIHCNL